MRYAQIPHEALDGLPDLNSIGLLAIMLRHRADFPFKVGDVIKQKKAIPGPKLGERVAYGAMTTLIQHRWAARVKYMCGRGHMHTAVWRTAQQLTDDDLRTIAEKYTAGTERILHCKGCSDDPEIPVRTVIRPGATLQGPWGDYEPIAALLAPDGRLHDAASAPVPGIAGTGTNRQNTPSPQVAPDPANPGTGAPGTGEPGTFKKNRENNSPLLPQAPQPRSEEEEDESKPTEKRPSAAGIVAEATGATPAEAQGVIDRLAKAAERQGRPIGAMAAYVRGCDPADLARHLAAVRKAADTERSRAAARNTSGAVCSEHDAVLPCRACRNDVEKLGDTDLAAALLEMHGPAERWDLAELLNVGGVR